jgi:small subunit ribosomal protein S20
MLACLELRGEKNLANIKSAKERVKVTAKKTLQNQMVKQELKTAIKKFNALIESNDKAEATVYYSVLIKMLDQALAKGIYHKNTIARRKSAFTKALNKLA